MAQQHFPVDIGGQYSYNFLSCALEGIKDWVIDLGHGIGVVIDNSVSVLIECEKDLDELFCVCSLMIGL